ncbi:Ig-like domain-containing protein, partial [Providencia vermicola]|uniref:Ig-like domain-containing protein n=1 Tax=Providencia vermicola TaxID=333965 RepID=UPI0036256A03
YEQKANEQGEWSISVGSPLADGAYDYKINVSDNAGNQAQETGTVIIDTKAPELTAHLETISATSEKGDEITNINTPKFSGTTEPDSKVLLTINNQTYEQKANEQGEWSISVGSPLADGAYDYEINVYDKAKNQAQFKGKMTVYTELPDATVTLAPIDNTVATHVDIPQIDSTMMQIEVDNHYF